MKLDGAGDGPPNRDGSNNYSRQMAELVLREKQAKKRQVRIYIQNVFLKIVISTIQYFFVSGRC